MAEEVIEAGLETGTEESGSPPDTEETGVSGEEAPTSQGVSEEESPASKEKPAPYDNDPKWKAARASKARAEEIMKNHGLDDFDDIEDALEEIGELRKDLDGKDLKQLVKDQEKLKKLLVKMEKDEQAVNEEDETLDETVERLKRENKDLKGARSKAETKQKEHDDSVREIQAFNSEVSKVLENEEVPKEHQNVLKVFLGVDNPADEVNTGNKREIRRMAKEGVKKFNDFVETVQQKAIDDYAAGKGKVTPIGKAKVVPKEAEKKEAPKGQTSDEYFDAKRKELLEAYGRSAEAT